jgi:ribosomal-protein-alanine N-acetyltransferase
MRLRIQPDPQEPGGLAPQGDLRTIHLKHPRVAPRGAPPGSDPGAGQKTQLHQAARIIVGQVNAIQDSGIPPAQVDQGGGYRFLFALVATQLQHDSSMRWSESLVKGRAFLLLSFFCHRFQIALKCAKIKDNRMKKKRYSIRRSRPADLDRIMEIERASFGPDAYDRNLFAEYTRRCGELFLVAERSRKVCGYALTCRRAGAFRNRAELVSLAVDPAMRGRGVASALMESTLRRLRLRGVSRFGLTVKVTNEGARAFYEKYGFIKVRRVRRYYEDGEDGWLMAKRLA